mgnify:CR=1 FL=1
MKQSPQTKKLEEMMRSSKIVSGGFLGSDQRQLSEIIDADIAEVQKAGRSIAQVVERMTELTAKANELFENWVQINDNLQVMSREYKGKIICPWPHAGTFDKRVTTAKRMDCDKEICWTDLNIHMIAEHGFFEGKGVAFRVDPKELIDIIF